METKYFAKKIVRHYTRCSQHQMLARTMSVFRILADRSFRHSIRSTDRQCVWSG